VATRAQSPTGSSSPKSRTTDRRQRGRISLAVVGTGIRLGLHLTGEARHEIEAAEEVLYVAADPASDVWLASLNANARSLSTHYREGVPRRQIYDEMVDDILDAVRAGKRVCAVFYGHPGVYVNPSHEAVRRAREEGFEARMLPAVSSEDCLVADLGVDPGSQGWQSWDATGFLLRSVRPDPTAGLVLWQVDGIGKLDWNRNPDPRGLRVLADVLGRLYPQDHELIFYRASPYPILDGEATRLPLRELPDLAAAPAPTLYIAPLPPRQVDSATAARLGITL
jgi:Tetrapyrrole (Corrin/Porphyrin) Methylases